MLLNETYNISKKYVSYYLFTGQLDRPKRSSNFFGDIKTKFDDVINFSWSGWFETLGSNIRYKGKKVERIRNQLTKDIK